MSSLVRCWYGSSTITASNCCKTYTTDGLYVLWVVVQESLDHLHQKTSLPKVLVEMSEEHFTTFRLTSSTKMSLIVRIMLIVELDFSRENLRTYDFKTLHRYVNKGH